MEGSPSHDQNILEMLELEKIYRFLHVVNDDQQIYKNFEPEYLLIILEKNVERSKWLLEKVLELFKRKGNIPKSDKFKTVTAELIGPAVILCLIEEQKFCCNSIKREEIYKHFILISFENLCVYACLFLGKAYKFV